MARSKATNNGKSLSAIYSPKNCIKITTLCDKFKNIIGFKMLTMLAFVLRALPIHFAALIGLEYVLEPTAGRGPASVRNAGKQKQSNRSHRRQHPHLQLLDGLRSDLTLEQRAEALRIGRIGFASAGARRKPQAEGSHRRLGSPLMASLPAGPLLPYRPIRNNAWSLAARDRPMIPGAKSTFERPPACGRDAVAFDLDR